MACLLQPECNFLHGFFRCRLLVEVVDIEVKITSMQGMHIFRRDRTTQLMKCTPWSTRLCPHPTIIKKMKTFLEVEGKMDRFQFQHQVTNSGLHSQKLIQMLEEMMLQKRERELHPRRSSGQPPPNLPQHTLPDQRLHQSLRIVHPYHQYQQEKTPHGPGAGKMLGNLFEDRNWLLPKNYLATENKMRM